MTASSKPNPAAPDVPPSSHRELIELAASYAEAAEKLKELWKKGVPLSQAPFRFVAIHAIELYLNAYLETNDHDPKEIRGLQHDLQKKTNCAMADGLKLKLRTVKYLGKLTANADYTCARYKPASLKQPAPPSQLLAAMNDVKDKVAMAVAQCG